MVSAAKYARAERDLKSARSYGAGAQGMATNHSPFAFGKLIIICFTHFDW